MELAIIVLDKCIIFHICFQLKFDAIQVMFQHFAIALGNNQFRLIKKQWCVGT